MFYQLLATVIFFLMKRKRRIRYSCGLKQLSQILPALVSDMLTSDQYPKARGLSFDVQDRVKKLDIQTIDEGRVDQ